jgi:hypothetical protein
MRHSLLAISILSTLGLRLCGGGDEPPAPVTAEPAATASATGTVALPAMGGPAPGAVGRRGGTVVMAGAHQVEVVPRADGAVHAYVAGPGGAVPPPAQVQLTVSVTGADAQKHAVPLVWNPAEVRFEGRVQGVAIAPGPAEVSLAVGGPPVVVVAPIVAIAPATVVVRAPEARVDVRTGAPGGVVVADDGKDDARVEVGVAGDVVVEGPRAGVVVGAPAAGVVVEGPRAGVVVGAPAAGVVVDGPRAGVVVGAPAAGVVVEGPRGGVVVGAPAAGVVVEGARGGVVVGGPAAGVVVQGRRSDVLVAPATVDVRATLGVDVRGGGGGVIVYGDGHGPRGRGKKGRGHRVYRYDP